MSEPQGLMPGIPDLRWPAGAGDGDLQAARFALDIAQAYAKRLEEERDTAHALLHRARERLRPMAAGTATLGAAQALCAELVREIEAALPPEPAPGAGEEP